MGLIVLRAVVARMTKSWVGVNTAPVRRIADTERDRGNWAVAAYHYRRVLDSEPNDAAIWIQHGHMLKEAGLMAEAALSYGRALALQPDDQEIHVQIAILSKLQGNFAAAMDHFQAAARLGYQPDTFIKTELSVLRKASVGPTVPTAIATGGRRIYLSSVFLPSSEIEAGTLKKIIGAAHYSYGYIMKGYQEALERAGYHCVVINNPEYLPNIEGDGPQATSLHIGFYPPDGARYLKGAYNIICIAWEFERLKSRIEATSYHAFSDPVAMLAGARETWAISSYGAAAATRSGVRDVRFVPTPVFAARAAGRPERPALPTMQQISIRLDRLVWEPLAIWPSIQDHMSNQARARTTALLNLLLDADPEQPPLVFVSVFNVHDYRKQMKPVIEAFTRFTSDFPDAYLLLKVSCIDSDRLDVNRMMFMDQISDAGEMTAPLVSDRILMTTEALTRTELDLLYELAAFYICTSHAEGQNLPLIEAMGHGVVPVSVDHTAMADYIEPTNAIVVPSRRGALTPRLIDRYGLSGTHTYFVESRDVYHALQRARALSGAEYAALSAASVDTVQTRFGLAPFSAAVEQAVERMAAQAGLDS